MTLKLKTVTYSNAYIDLSREELLEQVSQVMSDKRFTHVKGVEQAALELAERYGANLEQVSIAALLHDFAKEQSDEEMRDIIISENMDLELLQYGNNIWHGPVGAVVVRNQFSIQDQDILDAIRHHTVGSPHMGIVEQIIYLADYIEPNRTFKGVDKARKLAEIDMEKGIAYATFKTLKHLLNKNVKIYPKAIETYNAWVVQKQEELHD
ncbi:bis(5'-nucleosyl)-tetraphosphatase (symmetrical) YqeK [Marinilactibacillus sp. Marseille-P9653]|uniref:bis(5'-nucleosyl)-tetraphosphatase (symmetrical) YqeK n=1 Tax=Marinilactibacillus sp. Marseille-P9653 TaxID=2866583 RepID=UPI001CE42CEC|nr:bis(5'-nucleosyl)-tetraphosphatase (symmetrical) YqeK [Marinilactibacillus sp. Marseille-P9653]